jgi:hypothetical protein
MNISFTQRRKKVIESKPHAAQAPSPKIEADEFRSYGNRED